MKCRFCDEELIHSMIDLGMSPLANAYLNAKSLQQEELFYPLQVFVCHKCFLKTAMNQHYTISFQIL